MQRVQEINAPECQRAVVLSPQARAIIAACLLPNAETTTDEGESAIFAPQEVWDELRAAFPKSDWLELREGPPLPGIIV